MNHKRNTAWEQYEAGKAYKRRLGLYETVRRPLIHTAWCGWGGYFSP